MKLFLSLYAPIIPHTQAIFSKNMLKLTNFFNYFPKDILKFSTSPRDKLIYNSYTVFGHGKFPILI
ncbi:MAG: hypothetical protein RSB53_02030, partial [Oscillospiraceae bacterium]